jgi:hypothetical protein
MRNIRYSLHSLLQLKRAIPVVLSLLVAATAAASSPHLAHADTYTIDGNVYVDANGNGVKDTGEANQSSVTVKLLNSPGGTQADSATTDSSGNYTFTNVAAADYTVAITMPSGYIGTTVGLINFRPITANQTVNFGIKTLPSSSTLFSDQFTGTDNTPVTSHDSNWVVEAGTEPTLQSNTLFFNAEGEGIGLDNFTKTVDQCASFDVQFPLSSLIANHVRRSVDASNNVNDYASYLTTINENGYVGFNLYYDADGNYNIDLPKYDNNLTVPADGWHNFKVCAIGTEVSAYLDNALLSSATDSHVTSPGFANVETSINNVDNYKYEAITPQLSALDAARVYISKAVNNHLNRFNIKAEVYKDSTLVTSGEIDNVNPGTSATLESIPFNSFSAVDMPAGSQLKIKLYACSAAGPITGTATLSYNASSVDSRFGATIGGTNSTYHLLSGSVLGTSSGSSAQTVSAQSTCSSGFTSFGTWSVTL